MAAAAQAAKQQVLKPQDLVVTLKICVNRQRDFLLVELAAELLMPLSVVHGCIKRSEQARLLSRSAGSVRALRPAVEEFVIHGAKYAFPATLGPLTKGMPTAIASPALRSFFDADSLAPVWPHPEGSAYGPAVTPLHSGVPDACKRDSSLLNALTLLDALRTGAAREREIAETILKELFA